MIRRRFNKVLLVAPDNCPRRLAAEYDYVKHVPEIDRLFPVIFDFKPDLVLFDYEYVKCDLERIVRRLRMNPFYNKTKICCYKVKPNRDTDDFLKAIGVNYFIYPGDLVSDSSTDKVSIFSAILDASLMRVLAKVAH
ncbi:hypothetical protein DJ568_10870 [Mucilaginibacter hurinus]|uniref:Response regulatory domain-containing protein n=1 Tax=Mucilaginibacter hurinus TaxID=2201324 RepID=A0A367GPF7_9SPHI|nr:hypothetical protein [Mucilaginibacter hurinus]RCH54968.1 hypothetical protein DJ568_10870 [Mucilaginibacter hurinus]